MKNKIAMIAAAGLLAPAIASADLSYNFVEANYIYYDGIDADIFGDQDLDGFRLKGSTALTPDIFLFGEYGRISDDIDLDQGHIGLGYRAEVAPQTDIYGGVSLEYAKVDVGFADDDDFGFGLRAGARTLISEFFEVKGELRYVDHFDDFFGFNLGVQFHVTPQLGLILEYDNFDGDNGIIVGGRFNF